MNVEYDHRVARRGRGKAEDVRNSTVIAQCLMKAKMAASLEDGDLIVRSVFLEEFPGHVFNDGNAELDDKIASNLIRTTRSARINVRNFSQDLSTERL